MQRILCARSTHTGSCLRYPAAWRCHLGPAAPFCCAPQFAACPLAVLRRPVPLVEFPCLRTAPFTFAFPPRLQPAAGRSFSLLRTDSRSGSDYYQCALILPRRRPYCPGAGRDIRFLDLRVHAVVAWTLRFTFWTLPLWTCPHTTQFGFACFWPNILVGNLLHQPHYHHGF